MGWLVGNQLHISLTAIGTVLGALFGTLVAVVVATVLSRARGVLPRAGATTQRREAALVRGLADISRARGEIHQLGSQTALSDESAEATVRDVLASAHGALDRGELTQRVELARVRLIRWRNRLAPFTDADFPAGDDKRFELLVALRDQGARLLTEWVAGDIGARARGREAIHSLQSTLQDCERLVTRCVATRAQRVLDGVDTQILRVDPASGDELIRDHLVGAASLAPDELREVQHTIDRIAAAEELGALQQTGSA